jgi:hypothetical protein
MKKNYLSHRKSFHLIKLFASVIIFIGSSHCTKTNTTSGNNSGNNGGNTNRNNGGSTTAAKGCVIAVDSEYQNGSWFLKVFHYNDSNQILSMDDGVPYIAYQGRYLSNTYIVSYFINQPDYIAGFVQTDGNLAPTDTVNYGYDGTALVTDAHTQDLFKTEYKIQDPGGGGLDAIYLSYANHPQPYLDIAFLPYGPDIKNPYYTTSKENQFIYYLLTGEYSYQSPWPTDFQFYDPNDPGKVISKVKYEYTFDSNNRVTKRISSQAADAPAFTNYVKYDEHRYGYACK